VKALRQQVGQRVRALRERSGLTQEALGVRANLSYKFIGEVERGEANPSLESLGHLAEALAVDVASLFHSGEGAARYATLSAGQYAAVRQAKEALEGLLTEGRDGAVAPQKRKK
jgi:transcriptional regulator with XRE-family HTH domain